MSKKIFSQDPSEYIIKLAEALKEIPEFQIPEWAFFVKTGTSRERPPSDDDFWYTRAASILRQLYIKGVVGVGKLRVRYGSRKNRGGRPDQFRKASGKIIRIILQQAEGAGLVEKISRLQHGRRLTEKGRDFLDSIDVEVKDSINLDDVLVKDAQPVIEQEIGSDIESEEDDNKEEQFLQEEEEKKAPESVPPSEDEGKKVKVDKIGKEKDAKPIEDNSSEAEEEAPLGVPPEFELGGKDGE